MKDSGERLETLRLVEEELVAGRGSSAVNWFVRKNDGWVRAGTYPGARVERLSRGPGVVWRTRVELELPRGALLERVASEPLGERASTVEHLTRARPGVKRRTVRTRYRVGPRGELERVT